MSRVAQLKEKEDLKDLENLDVLYRELNSVTLKEINNKNN